MTVRRAEKLIDEIFKENSTEVGIFISMLANEYLKRTNATEEKFFKSLKNSLKILKETDEKDKEV